MKRHYQINQKNSENHFINNDLKNFVIVTDVDGTLIDSDKVLRNVLHKILTDFRFDDEKIKSVLARINHGSLEGEINEEFGVGYELKTMMEEMLINEVEKANFSLLPDVAKALSELKDMGCVLSIATNNYSKNVWSILLKNKIDLFFKDELVFTFDNFIHKKPSRALIDEIFSRSGCNQGLIIGNTGRDIAFANNSGLPIILLSPSTPDIDTKTEAKDIPENIKLIEVEGWLAIPRIVASLVLRRTNSGGCF